MRRHRHIQKKNIDKTTVRTRNYANHNCEGVSETVNGQEEFRDDPGLSWGFGGSSHVDEWIRLVSTIDIIQPMC